MNNKVYQIKNLYLVDLVFVSFCVLFYALFLAFYTQ